MYKFRSLAALQRAQRDLLKFVPCLDAAAHARGCAGDEGLDPEAHARVTAGDEDAIVSAAHAFDRHALLADALPWEGAAATRAALDASLVSVDTSGVCDGLGEHRS